jgi:hypothetical protein
MVQQVRRNREGFALDRLRRMAKMLHRGPFMEELGGSREAHMMIMELACMLDHPLHRIESRRPRIAGTAAAGRLFPSSIQPCSRLRCRCGRTLPGERQARD